MLAIFSRVSSRGTYLSPQDPWKLEFRSTYVGFDELYANKSTATPLHQPFSNGALRYFHLSAEDPTMHLPSLPPHKISAGGYTPTENHLYQLIVTPDVSCQNTVLRSKL